MQSGLLVIEANDGSGRHVLLALTPTPHGTKGEQQLQVFYRDGHSHGMPVFGSLIADVKLTGAQAAELKRGL